MATSITCFKASIVSGWLTQHLSLTGSNHSFETAKWQQHFRRLFDCQKQWAKRFEVVLAVWPHPVKIKCFGNKNSFNVARWRSLLTATAAPCTFSRKNWPMMPRCQKLNQTVTRCACTDCTIFRQKCSSLAKWSLALWANKKRIGWSRGFTSWADWTMWAFKTRSLCKIPLRQEIKLLTFGQMIFNSLRELKRHQMVTRLHFLS